MEIKIFDVTHGFCALLKADNGALILFDCGHNEKTGFRPSAQLRSAGVTRLDYLVIQNFDQDHISDLPNLRRTVHVDTLYRNKSIPAEVLLRWKIQSSGFITTAMESALELHTSYVYDAVAPSELSNIELSCYCNDYPTFEDTNNLSMVSFVHYDGFGIIFTGDIEKAGWTELLKNYWFREHLRRVNIFIASHHGRESGYCGDVFNYCTPDIVIISDKEIIHETQKLSYAKHARGLPWNSGTDRRYVLTTRCDGMITISKSIGSGYYVQTSC